MFCNYNLIMNMDLSRKKLLKNILIRILYIVPCFIFIFGFIFNITDLSLESSLRVQYWIVFIVPILIFGYQSFRNSIVGWILVMLLYIAYLILLLINFFDYIGYSAAKFSENTAFQYLAFLIIYICVGVLYFLIRPKDKMI